MGWGCADVNEAMENVEEEEADPGAGVGVLAPGKAAAKAARQKAADSRQTPGQADRLAGNSAVPSAPSVPREPGPQPQSRGKEHAGFEEVPLQGNGVGGNNGSDSDSDSDAGLAEMDDHSRAEVCISNNACPPHSTLASRMAKPAGCPLLLTCSSCMWAATDKHGLLLLPALDACPFFVVDEDRANDFWHWA